MENIKLLAQNKLIILYALSLRREEMRNTELTHFIVENNYMDYFLTHHYLSELINTGNIKLSYKMGEPCYQITEKGQKALQYFESRIPKDIKEKIKLQFEEIQKQEQIERQISAAYFEAHPNDFVVNLKALENEKAIFSLSLSVTSKAQAIEICNRWKAHSADIYKSMIYLFVNSEPTSK